MQREQLADVLSEFARTMVTDFPIQAILDRLVERIVEILPITGAGVTLISPGRDPQYVAASSSAALRFERLQTELDEGPCLAAYRTGTAISIPDLDQEQRFRRFVPRALDAGLAAVFTFPLRHGDAKPLGALDLYRDTPGALSADSMGVAQTLADVAASYLLNAHARQDLLDASAHSHEAALHDALTGLPNRILLLERLDHALLRERRSDKHSALLFIDLNRFKDVNDAHGHQVGDHLLIAIAERLPSVLRPADTLARMSGDEFVILCEDLDDRAEADLIVARITALLAQPFVLANATLAITASVGVAFAERHAARPEQLLHQADLAMYRAKRTFAASRTDRGPYEPDGHDKRLDLQEALAQAASRDELHLAYQPIVTAADGDVTAVEALLRWTHPTHGAIPPGVVIPLAERSGLIVDIGRWVLHQACTEQHRWQHSRNEPIAVAVNVSAHQLMAGGFLDDVAAVLEATSTDPALLCMEVTESIFVRDGERALHVLRQLKHMGIALALDDFGTGYSSLSYLMRYPVDILKIDRSFIAALGHDSPSTPIITAVVQLAHGLGMTVVCEGVETAPQHHELTRLGTDSCQGFHFAPPMSLADLEALVGQRADGRDLHLPARSRTGCIPSTDCPGGRSG
ncbi:bifunctional diguanylate cyclase/phosphodiesterase [Conexibacter sp. CPCC 206217]|uniref:putative bifunctional diguanylate cyclase/phosphodiesterase n=1 Tax=Conexibacter sp. CPCC 206217 TaxID=3064574 RepID=UPI00271B2270|nr:GGDEF domain-containing protein [Conexibacter sp. CPCC 206217]MDO8209104.1 GGDEF domain-containing protein [Conexibacter sp. CPCC 206217]